MKAMQILAIILVFCLAVQGVGCSMTIMNKVPDDYTPSQELHCGWTLWPFLDGLITLLSGTVASLSYYGISQINCDGHGDCGRTTLFVSMSPLWMIFLLYAISTGYGFHCAHECDETFEAHRKWRRMTPEQQKEFEVQWRGRAKPGMTERRVDGTTR